jgi:uncharacterized protein
MIPAVQHKHPQLAALCRKYGARRLELFGSAATESEFDAECSDLDFLVEVEPSDDMGPADQYFGLWEDLKALFGREVDLDSTRSLRNPYFIASVSATRQTQYAS